MARDEAILRAVEKGGCAPTVRLYEWLSPTLSVGCRQEAGRFTGCGVPFVRRITGGGAVLHNMELTYCVVCGSAHPLFSAGIMGAYMAINGCIVNALRDIGIGAYFSLQPHSKRTSPQASCFDTPSRYEILVRGRKVVGSCQRRFKRAFLQHGSILFDVDEGLVSRIFGAGAGEKMAWVKAFSDTGKDEFRGTLVERFEEGLGVRFKESVMNKGEEEIKGLIAGWRYSKEGWNIGAEAAGIEDRLASLGV